MRIKWHGLSLGLLPMLAFAALAAADEKVVEKEILLDETGGKKVVVKIVSDGDEKIRWQSEDGEVIVIEVDGDDEDFVRHHGPRGRLGRAYEVFADAFDDEDEDGAWLGVTLADVDKDEARDAGLRRQTGARVLRVLEDSAAEAAGIQAGDIVTRFDGRRIDDAGELQEAVASREPGDEVEIQIYRDRQKRDVACTLGERERGLAYLAPDDLHNLETLKRLDVALPEGEDDLFVRRILGGFPHGPRLGVEIRDLDKDMATYFPGAEPGQVLVMGITEGSVAEKSGLLAGDVITAFGGEKLDGSDDLRRAVREAEADTDLGLDLLRRGEPMSISVRFEEPERDLAAVPAPKLRQLHRWRGFDDEALEERLEQLEKKMEELMERLD